MTIHDGGYTGCEKAKNTFFRLSIVPNLAISFEVIVQDEVVNSMPGIDANQATK